MYGLLTYFLNPEEEQEKLADTIEERLFKLSPDDSSQVYEIVSEGIVLLRKWAESGGQLGNEE